MGLKFHVAPGPRDTPNVYNEALRNVPWVHCSTCSRKMLWQYGPRSDFDRTTGQRLTRRRWVCPAPWWAQISHDHDGGGWELVASVWGTE